MKNNANTDADLFIGVFEEPNETPINILKSVGARGYQRVAKMFTGPGKDAAREIEKIIQESDPGEPDDPGEPSQGNNHLSPNEDQEKPGPRKRRRQQKRMGEILVSKGQMTEEQLAEALSIQARQKGKHIGAILVENGMVTEEQLLVALANRFDLPFVDLNERKPSAAALRAISPTVVREYRVFPLEIRNNTLVVATSQPTNSSIIADALRFHAQRYVDLVVASREQIAEAIDNYFRNAKKLPESEVEKEPEPETEIEAEQVDVTDILQSLTDEQIEIEEQIEDNGVGESDSLLIKLLNNILIEGYQTGASDIHVETTPGRQPSNIRYRIDGICRLAHRIPSTYKRAFLSRLKILSNLDITERRRPQSGRIITRVGRRKVEYRLEITPTMNNLEDAVLRILANSKPLPLEKMGFSDSNLEAMRECLAKPYGLVLCVGPTGSGKTTTLHSALGYLNQPTRKIWTAEDPVEISQVGLRQVQVNPKIGFTFAEALRSFLRADPDIIMIGEMRDSETAKIAVDASITGHLVLSTLHTNSAPETVVRLIEMGVDPINFADALLGILAQRLGRNLCPKCMEKYQPDEDEYEAIVETYGREMYTGDGLPEYSADLLLTRATGCPSCDQSGYKGRMALHELLTGTPAIRKAIRRRLDAGDIKDLGIEEGMRTLMMDGIAKMFKGHTDLSEVRRVCM